MRPPWHCCLPSQESDVSCGNEPPARPRVFLTHALGIRFRNSISILPTADIYSSTGGVGVKGVCEGTRRGPQGWVFFLISLGGALHGALSPAYAAEIDPQLLISENGCKERLASHFASPVI